MTPSPRLLWTAFAAVVCIIALIAVLSFLSDPFGIRSWFANREKARVETIESDLSARTLESEGRAGQLTRTETYHREVITIQSATEPFAAEARSAPDANTPLDTHWRDLLRRSNGSLCQHVTCSPAAPDDPAGPAVRR